MFCSCVGLLIFICSNSVYSQTEYTMIAGTKVSLKLPSNFERITNTNVYKRYDGAVISSSELPVPINEVIKDFIDRDKKERVGIVDSSDTNLGDNNKILSIDQISDNRYLVCQSLTKDYMKLNTYTLIVGNDKETAFVFCSGFEYMGKEKLDLLQSILKTAKWDYNAKKNFRSYLFYSIMDNDIFKISSFNGDRFEYEYLGEKISDSDKISMHIGSHSHKYKIQLSDFSLAAKKFSFRPPLDENNLDSLVLKNIKQKILEGIRLDFSYLKDGQIIHGLNYIFFRPFRLYFLRVEIQSDSPEYYFKKILPIFDSFELKYNN